MARIRTETTRRRRKKTARIRTARIRTARRMDKSQKPEEGQNHKQRLKSQTKNGYTKIIKIGEKPKLPPINYTRL